MGVSILGVSYSNSLVCPAPGSGTPAGGDLIVLLTSSADNTPAVPSAVSGCGATWALVHASTRTTVWIGTAPTSIGVVTATATATSRTAAWWIRDADPVLTSASWADSVVGGVQVSGSAVTVGPTQAILALAHPSDALPGSAALPTSGAWTAAASTSLRRAHAAPNTPDTYQATSIRSGSRTVLVQAVIGSPPPNAPTGLTLTPTETTIAASWVAPSGVGAATGYTVSLDGGFPYDVGNVLTDTLTGLTPGTNYVVEVRAYNAAGPGPAAPANVSTLGPPGQPSGLVLTPTETTIAASWVAPVGPETVEGYEILLDGVPFDVGNVLTYTLTGLTPSTSYEVEVRAYSVAGSGVGLVDTALTLSPAIAGGYAATLRVGAHTWDVDSDNAASYGPTAPIRFGWTAREDDGWPTQHDPTILSFGVVVAAGDDFDDVDQGTWVHYTFTPEGFADPLVEFGGTVRDLVARPHPLGMIFDLVAVDALQALQEDYTTAAFIDDGTPLEDLYPQLVADAGGAGMGEGTRPYLPDPLSGQDIPAIPGGFTFGDLMMEGPTWDVLTGFFANLPRRAGSGGVTFERVILSYQLDGDGDLSSTMPFVGTWMAPPVVGDLDDVTLDACLLRTDAAEWSRPRTEPNVARVPGLGDFVRPHTGPDIVRVIDVDSPRTETDYDWIVRGVEASSQWSTRLEVLADQDASSVAGWFTLPAAMRTFVTTTNIEARHTPDGSGTYSGLLSGAALVVRPGGAWGVEFTLRRTLPDLA